MRPFTQIILSKEQKQHLQANIKPTTQYRFIQRINTILLAAQGKNNKQISKKVNLSVVAVSHWRTRYAKHGIDGLKDLPRSGKPPKYDHDQRLKLIDVACQPPSLKARWTIRELSQKTGISKSQLHRILHELDLKPHQFKIAL